VRHFVDESDKRKKVMPPENLPGMPTEEASEKPRTCRSQTHGRKRHQRLTQPPHPSENRGRPLLSLGKTTTY